MQFARNGTPKIVHDHLTDHLLRVYRFAIHLCGDQHVAEDLAQEAMLKAIRSDSLRDTKAAKVWLLRVTKNLWIDWCRARQNRPHQFDVLDTELEQNIPTPLEQISIAEDVAKTLSVMRKLPQRQQTVLHLTACEELTVMEISEVLQITPEAVRSSLSLARARMRQELPFEDSVVPIVSMKK